MMESVMLGEYSLVIYLPPSYGQTEAHYPIIYYNGRNPSPACYQEELERAFSEGHSREFVVAYVQSPFPERDYTPWKQADVFRPGQFYDGGCKAYIGTLIGEVLPYIQTHYRVSSAAADTALMGYSLGGLAALYAATLTDRFGVIGCLSGSLWYDGFVDYLEDHPLLPTNSRVYLSLGKTEERSRNPYLSRVGDCTKQVYDILDRQITNASDKYLCLQPGGHFTDIEKRILSGFLWAFPPN